MCIDDGNDRLVGFGAQLIHCSLGGAGEPAAINHDNTVVALDKTEIGVVNEFRSIDTFAKLFQGGLLDAL